MKIKLTIVLSLIMAVINNINVLQANVKHWAANEISFYNNIKIGDPDVLLLNEYGVRNNGQIKIYGKKQN